MIITHVNSRFSPDGSSVSYILRNTDHVYHMEMDLYKSGNVLFSTRGALQTTDGTTRDIVLGSSTEFGLADGIGKSARFNYLHGFHHINKYTILAADRDNNCIRKLSRNQQSKVTGSIGLCSDKGGYKDGYSSKAKFSKPAEIISDSQDPYHVFITDNSAIRYLDFHLQHVSTFVQDKEQNFQPRGITQDSTSGDLYVTSTEHNVFYVNYKSKTLSLLAGKKSKYTFKDGNFGKALFWYPHEILIIDHGRKLVVVNQDGPGLRLLDLQTTTTSTLCDTEFKSFPGKSTQPTSEKWKHCGGVNGQRSIGYSLLKYGTKLLIGGEFDILAVTGKPSKD